MAITIALAGNPNCGKTTLFNELTGANQFVGNWPGVTVEKKEGRLKGHKDVVITDLPGIYSLSPYTLEEVVARNYLINERPDAIINIIDGTNIERNLYLSTQIMELGIPVVMAVNMMDLLEKSGDKVYIDKLSKSLGCEVVEISALKGTGVQKAAEKAIAAAQKKNAVKIVHEFDPKVESAIAEVEAKLSGVEESQKRFFAIKLIERDDKIGEQMKNIPDVSAQIKKLEDEFDDDTESIITNERYSYISGIIGECISKKHTAEKLTTSDKIDKIVTNRWLALPIFAVIMWFVYYVSISTVGTMATDWVNDGLFGDGFFLFGNGREEYDAAAEDFSRADQIVAAVEEGKTTVDILDDAGDIIDTVELTSDVTEEAEAYLAENEEPDPADYGNWVNSIPVVLESGLDAIGTAEWLKGMILNGIVGGVGAVLGFLPQMIVLFIFLALLEACGYMARIAFIMDRIFRKFGLSGKSFIPMLIGTGCGVPGVMASRTIENERDRRMTIMTTTFIPCSAKLPIIGLLAGSVFGGASWVAPTAYFVGIAAIVTSGIILKKTKLFAGDPAPFVMELPAYHMPTLKNVARSVWERASSFVKKAGTIILLSTMAVWFLMNFGFVDGSFRMLAEEELNSSILASFGRAVAWIFSPLGWGDWRMAVAALTGLVAKENLVGTFGILFGFGGVAENGRQVWAELGALLPAAAGFSFLTFNLLCAPCFAAMGAIKREMNSRKWFWVAIGYQCGFAYLVSLCINQIWGLIAGTVSFGFWTIVTIVLVIGFIYLLFRPYKEATTLKVDTKKTVGAR